MPWPAVRGRRILQGMPWRVAQSSSPAGRAELTLQTPPSHDTEPWAGPCGDGEWPGADMGWGVIPNPEDILGFVGREFLSLQLAVGRGCAWGCSVCWVLPCTQCSHMEMCHCRVAPLDVPLSPMPCCHPQGHATLCCPCVQTMWLEGQQLQVAGRRSAMLLGLFPSSVDCRELWDRGWHTCGTAVTTSPASRCLSPAIRGHIPFSVPNKPSLVTAGDLCFVLLSADRAVTQGCTCGDTGLGLSEQTPVQVWALDL